YEPTSKPLRRGELVDDEVEYYSLEQDKDIVHRFCVTTTSEEEVILIDRDTIPEKIKRNQQPKQEKKEREEKHEEKKYPPPTLEDIQRLVRMLNVDRADDREQWRNVLFALRFVFD